MAALLKVPEAVERLGLPKNTVYELIRAGRIKTLKIKRLRVPEEALREFIKTYEGYDLSDPFNPVLIDFEKEAELDEDCTS